MRSAPALVLLLVVAGCFGGGGSQAEPSVSAPAAPGGETGTIEGLVVDDAFTALSGAVVGIPTLGASSNTDGQGRFRLENIPVGSHDLYANKLGYEQAGQRVTVNAGEVTDAEFNLAPMAADAPFVEIVEHIGFMNCGLGVDLVVTALATTAACTQDPNHKANFEFEVQPDVQTAVGELVWVPTAGFAAQSLRLALWQNPRCSPCDPEYDYGESIGPSPVYVRADRFRGISEEEPTTVHWYVWTPWTGSDLPVVVVLNQKFSVYASTFYGSTAPDGYSAAPEA